MRCERHPESEHVFSCVECGSYICARCMVDTPVGYKCRECGRSGAASPVKRDQWAKASTVAVLASALAAFLYAEIAFRTGYSGPILALVLGVAVGEATRRASGGHRDTGIAALAAGSAALAFGIVNLMRFVWLDEIGLLAAAAGAFFWVRGAR